MKNLELILQKQTLIEKLNAPPIKSILPLMVSNKNIINPIVFSEQYKDLFGTYIEFIDGDIAENVNSRWYLHSQGPIPNIGTINSPNDLIVKNQHKKLGNSNSPI